MDDQQSNTQVPGDEEAAVIEAWTHLAMGLPRKNLFFFFLLKDCHEELKQTYAEELKHGTTLPVLMYQNRHELLNAFQNNPHFSAVMNQRVDLAFMAANKKYASQIDGMKQWPQCSPNIPDPPHGPLVVIVGTTIVFALPPSTSITKALSSGMIYEYEDHRRQLPQQTESNSWLKKAALKIADVIHPVAFDPHVASPPHIRRGVKPPPQMDSPSDTSSGGEYERYSADDKAVATGYVDSDDDDDEVQRAIARSLEHNDEAGSGDVHDDDEEMQRAIALSLGHDDEVGGDDEYDEEDDEDYHDDEDTDEEEEEEEDSDDDGDDDDSDDDDSDDDRGAGVAGVSRPVRGRSATPFVGNEGGGRRRKVRVPTPWVQIINRPPKKKTRCDDVGAPTNNDAVEAADEGASDSISAISISSSSGTSVGVGDHNENSLVISISSSSSAGPSGDNNNDDNGGGGSTPVIVIGSSSEDSSNNDNDDGNELAPVIIIGSSSDSSSSGNTSAVGGGHTRKMAVGGRGGGGVRGRGGHGSHGRGSASHNRSGGRGRGRGGHGKQGRGERGRGPASKGRGGGSTSGSQIIEALRKDLLRRMKIWRKKFERRIDNSSNAQFARDFLDQVLEPAIVFVMESRKAEQYHFGRINHMIATLTDILGVGATITADNLGSFRIRNLNGFRDFFEEYFESGQFPLVIRYGQF